MSRRNPTEEHNPRAVVKKTYRSQEHVKGQILNYSNADESKQNNEHSPLSQNSITSTGEVISPNGIRLWGMR